MAVRLGRRGTIDVTLRAVVRVAVDLSLLLLALVLAYFIRFDWQVPAERLDQLVLVAPFVIGLQYLLLKAFGATRHSWRYTSLLDITAVAVAAYYGPALIGVARAVGPLGALPLSWPTPSSSPTGSSPSTAGRRSCYWAVQGCCAAR
ncbi:MAG: hypothetical protein ACR2HR_12650 [Euzebya sp.]